MKVYSVIMTVLVAVVVFSVNTVSAGSLDLEVETGPVWFSRNDVRIPGDTGTKFDMLDLTGTGPDVFIRLYATYDLNQQHALRLTIAPLEVRGTGILDEDVVFEDATFSSGLPTRGTYQFTTYRLTYRWMFRRSDTVRLGIGGALLVRDASISLQQGTTSATKDDLGFVPLLHLYGAYRVGDRVRVSLDIEGAGSPQGRALDAAVKCMYELPSGWRASVGYRSLEGGADNDSVYTFSWLHYGVISLGYRF